MHDEIHHERLHRYISRYKSSTGPARDRAFDKIKEMVHGLIVTYADKLLKQPQFAHPSNGYGLEFGDVYGYLVSLLVTRVIKPRNRRSDAHEHAPGCIEMFDPSSGVRFTTFYSNWMWFAGMSFVSRQSRLIHIPSHARSKNTVHPRTTHHLTPAAVDDNYFGVSGSGGRMTSDDMEYHEDYDTILDRHVAMQFLATMPEKKAQRVLAWASEGTLEKAAKACGCTREWVRQSVLEAGKKWKEQANA